MVYDNVVLIGFMGSGKTSVGKILARHLFKEFVDVDTLIEEEQGATVLEIFAQHGEEYFRALESDALKRLTAKTGQVIATGGGLPIYNAISKKSLIVFIDADFDVILRRLSAKEHAKRPLLQDEKRARALFDERIDTYRKQATFTVDANQSINTFIHVIRDYILDKRVL